MNNMVFLHNIVGTLQELFNSSFYHKYATQLCCIVRYYMCIGNTNQPNVSDTKFQSLMDFPLYLQHKERCTDHSIIA